MTEAAKAPEKDEKPVAKAAKKTLMVFPVYGPMHDPETGVDYTGEGVPVERIDPWVQSQIEAKKLRVE